MVCVTVNDHTNYVGFGSYVHMLFDIFLWPVSVYPLYYYIVSMVKTNLTGVGERCMENKKKILRTRKIYPWRCIATRGGEHLHNLVDR